MKTSQGVLGLVAAAWAIGGAPFAAAATSTGSFGVSATVVATCTVAVGPWSRGPVCLRRSALAILPPTPPVVSFSRDPATGALVQTISF